MATHAWALGKQDSPSGTVHTTGIVLHSSLWMIGIVIITSKVSSLWYAHLHRIVSLVLSQRPGVHQCPDGLSVYLGHINVSPEVG